MNLLSLIKNINDLPYIKKYLKESPDKGGTSIEDLEDDAETVIGRFVDLGLPSGTLWSDRNLEAETLTDIGKYYRFGEWTKDLKPFQKVPSKKHLEELLKFTKQEWITKDNVRGLIFYGKNGKNIFIPAGGRSQADYGEKIDVYPYYYDDENDNELPCGAIWSLTPDEKYNKLAYELDFVDGEPIYINVIDTFCAQNIRPISKLKRNKLSENNSNASIDDLEDDATNVINKPFQEFYGKIIDALETAKYEGYVEPSQSREFIIDNEYEILLFSFDDTEIDNFSEMEWEWVHQAIDDWRCGDIKYNLNESSDKGGTSVEDLEDDAAESAISQKHNKIKKIVALFKLMCRFKLKGDRQNSYLLRFKTKKFEYIPVENNIKISIDYLSYYPEHPETLAVQFRCSKPGVQLCSPYKVKWLENEQEFISTISEKGFESTIPYGDLRNLPENVIDVILEILEKIIDNIDNPDLSLTDFHLGSYDFSSLAKPKPGRRKKWLKNMATKTGKPKKGVDEFEFNYFKQRYPDDFLSENAGSTSQEYIEDEAEYLDTTEYCLDSLKRICKQFDNFPSNSGNSLISMTPKRFQNANDDSCVDIKKCFILPEDELQIVTDLVYNKFSDHLFVWACLYNETIDLDIISIIDDSCEHYDLTEWEEEDLQKLLSFTKQKYGLEKNE